MDIFKRWSKEKKDNPVGSVYPPIDNKDDDIVYAGEESRSRQAPPAIPPNPYTNNKAQSFNAGKKPVQSAVVQPSTPSAPISQATRKEQEKPVVKSQPTQPQPTQRQDKATADNSSLPSVRSITDDIFNGQLVAFLGESDFEDIEQAGVDSNTVKAQDVPPQESDTDRQVVTEESTVPMSAETVPMSAETVPMSAETVPMSAETVQSSDTNAADDTAYSKEDNGVDEKDETDGTIESNGVSDNEENKTKDTVADTQENNASMNIKDATVTIINEKSEEQTDIAASKDGTTSANFVPEGAPADYSIAINDYDNIEELSEGTVGEYRPVEDNKNKGEQQGETAEQVVEHKSLKDIFCSLEITDRVAFLQNTFTEMQELFDYLSEFRGKVAEKFDDIAGAIDSLYRKIEVCDLSEAQEIVGKIQKFKKLTNDLLVLKTYLDDLMDSE